MKKLYAISSLAIGIVGLGVFFKPIIEIICGIGGLILSRLAKDTNSGMVMDGICHWGKNLAWLNIAWVCLEFILKMVGIELF